jgi:peptidoglycan/LPS O-acetylase OafA/YrhL
MLFHASQIGQRYFQYDFLGISELGRSGAYTFFFVLTGYLMYSLYRRHFGNPNVFGTFLLKRFMRIYPLYWLIMLVLVPIYFIVPSFGLGFEREPSAIIRSLLLWPQAQMPILPVTWSLTYVIWFYIVFSLFFLMKEKVMIALYSSWMTIIVLNVFGLIRLKESVPLQFLFSVFHLEFVMGIGVAAVAHKFSPKYSPLWMAGGTVLYVALWIGRHQLTNLPHVDFLHTVGSVLLLIGIIAWRGEESRLLKPLEAMGNASYSILLASLPMMSITFKLARAANAPSIIGAAWTIGICFLTALGLCLLFYRWIEQPLNVLLRNALPSVSRPKSLPVVNRPSVR